MRTHHALLGPGAVLVCALAAACGEAPSSPAPSSPEAPVHAPPGAAAPSASAPAAPLPDPAADAFAALLGEVVTEAGLVRYDRLASTRLREALDEIVAAFAAAPLPEDRAARLAFWINAYNVNVLAQALRESRRQGFESVQRVAGFFDVRRVTVAGEKLTLNRLENDRVRPLGEPRIHAALVCAAMSCPPLRAEPYRAADLDRQLDEQCRRWVNDPSKFRVIDGGLGTSEILEWYAADFESAAWKGPAGFVRAYAEPGGDLARLLAAPLPPALHWIPYDWSLNAAPASR